MQTELTLTQQRVRQLAIVLIALVSITVLSPVKKAEAADTFTSSFYSWSRSSPYFIYDKNNGTWSGAHMHGQVRAYVSFSNGERYKLTMRAGAGGAGTSTETQAQNECNKYTGSGDSNGGGALPNGSYSIINHRDDWNGGSIQGRAWHINNKYCSNGTTLRTELLFHSYAPEQGSWTDSRYKSYGCVKISWNDIVQLDNWYDSAYKPSLGSAKVQA